MPTFARIRSRRLLRGAAGLLLAVSCAGADPVAGELESLETLMEERIPPLQERIEAWRELAFLEPIVAEWKESEREHIAGWYEPATKRLYLSPTAEGRFGEGVLLHELVHALQDQHYDLQAVHAKAGDDEEMQAAIQTLVEGEAMLAVIELLDYDFERVAAAAPDEGDRDRAATYLEGSRYVRAVRDACGWDGVTRLFVDPPPSRAAIREVSGDADTPAGEYDRPCPGD